MLRLAHAIVSLARRLAPLSSQAELEETWRSELWHRARELDARGELGVAARLGLLRRSLGAFSHALWLTGRRWRAGDLLQDARYGIRGYIAKPLFTLVALLTLALGIGANTYIFSLVEGVLLNPFPYRDVDRLVLLGATFPKLSPRERYLEALSIPDYQAVLETSQTLDSFLALDIGNRDLGGIDEPQRLFTAAFWGDPFETLGMEPALGRGFTAEEVASRAPVAILSHRAWTQHLGGDPEAVGRPIIVNGSPRTLVGIMPPRLLLLDTDLWLPMWYEATGVPRSRRVLTILARLKDPQSLESANAELQAFSARISQDLAAEAPEYEEFRLAASPVVDVWAGIVGPAGALLLGAVGFVLLIVCANIGGLMLARQTSRSRELAVRQAVGAGRGRLIQQLVTESAILTLGGGALGVWVAHASLRATMLALPAEVPTAGIEVGINGTVLAYALLVSIICGVVVGLAPAISTTRIDLNASLRDLGRTGSVSARALRRGFVVLQIALSLVLLTGAGLLVKSLGNLSSVDPGLRVQNVLTMRMTLAWERYEGRMLSFYTQLLDEVEKVPGVRRASLATQFPPMVRRDQPIQIEGREPTSEGALPTSTVTIASAGLFETLDMTLLRGRGFTGTDTEEAPPVSVVNQTFASRYFPGDDAIGRRIRTGREDSDAPWTTIVGVVSDTRNQGVDREPAPELFHDYRQLGSWANQMHLLVRTAGPPAAALGSIREALRRVDPDQPIYNIGTLEELFASTVLTRRIVGLVLAALAAVALLLAGMGLYAVVAVTVGERRDEFGIRLALGASQKQLLARVLLQASKLVVVGVVLGLGFAIALARTLRGFLFEVDPYDPVVLVSTAAVLVGATLAAALGPARRAARTDPVATLR